MPILRGSSEHERKCRVEQVWVHSTAQESGSQFDEIIADGQVHDGRLEMVDTNTPSSVLG